MSKRKKNVVKRRVPRPAFQFTIRSLMLWTFVACATGTGANYLMRSLMGAEKAQFKFVMFVLAAPMLMMVLVSVLISIVKGWKR